MPIFFWKKEPRWKALVTIISVLAFMAAMIVVNIKNPISFTALKEKYAELIAIEKSHPLIFSLALFIFYILSVSLVIPDSVLLSLLAGALYPLPIAVFFISCCEMLGAWIFFSVFKKGFYSYVQKKQWALLERFSKDDFVHHEIWYLLSLRVSHIVPFWFTNVLAIFFKTRPFRFIWTTFVGTLPLSLVIAMAGRQLEVALTEKTSFSLHDVLNTKSDLILLAIGLMMLLPVVGKKILKKF